MSNERVSVVLNMENLKVLLAEHLELFFPSFLVNPSVLFFQFLIAWGREEAVPSASISSIVEAGLLAVFLGAIPTASLPKLDFCPYIPRTKKKVLWHKQREIKMLSVTWKETSVLSQCLGWNDKEIMASVEYFLVIFQGLFSHLPVFLKSACVFLPDTS